MEAGSLDGDSAARSLEAGGLAAWMAGNSCPSEKAPVTRQKKAAKTVPVDWQVDTSPSSESVLYPHPQLGDSISAGNGMAQAQEA